MKTEMREEVEAPKRLGLRQILKSSSWRSLGRTPYGYKPALILVAITFFQSFDSFTFGAALPEIARDLDIDVRSILGITAILGSVSTIGVILIAWLSDRVNRVRMVAIGTSLSGIFSVISTRATNLFTFAAPRVADDASDTISGVPRFSLLADYYPPESRGKVYAMLGSLSQVAGLLVPAVMGALLLAFGWRKIALLFGIPLIVVGVVALLVLKEPIRGYFERKSFGADEEVAKRAEEPKSFGEGFRTTWSVRTLRRLFVADIISSAGSVFFVLFGFFLTEQYGLNVFERSLIGYPAAILGIFGGYIGGGMIDLFTRQNPGRVLTLLGAFRAVAALALFGIALEPPIPVLVVIFALFGFGISMVGPAAGVVYSQVIPANIRTQGLQFIQLAGLPGLIIFTPLAGLLFDNYGYTTTFLTGVPILLIGGVVAATAGQFFDLDRRNAAAAALASQEWERAKAEGAGKLLVCRSINVEYDGVQVLFDVDFDVEEGEIVALLGTNGAGKSTLLKAISGIQEASDGAIVFDGRDITHMPPHEVATRGVVHMPGGRGVFPGLSVADNLQMATWLLEKDEAKRMMREVFELFPILREREGVQASTLSGGEQQMLSLAQAFLSKPRLLMIDELSLGLSPAVVGELLDIVKNINARGVTVIVVEQSVNLALTLAQRAVFMEKGEVRFFGPTSELLRRPDILRAVYVKGTGALDEGAQGRTLRSDRETRAVRLSGTAASLQVEGVVKRFGGVSALDGVSFDLRDGEILGIIGPNGAGKTTLFDVISGFEAPDEGVIRFLGDDVTNLTPEQRSQRGLIRRFQDARLFPSLTVYETLLAWLDRRLGVKNLVLTASQVPQVRRAERRIRKRADYLIELLDLQSYRDKFVKELSTGLRRIVDLACVLATEPKVLLLDEPSSGIAQAEAEELGPLLRRIRYETGCSLLIIEHDIPLITGVSDEMIALDQGRVVLRGSPEEVLNDDRVIESYLGTSEDAIQRSGALE